MVATDSALVLPDTSVALMKNSRTPALLVTAASLYAKACKRAAVCTLVAMAEALLGVKLNAPLANIQDHVKPPTVLVPVLPGRGVASTPLITNFSLVPSRTPPTRSCNLLTPLSSVTLAGLTSLSIEVALAGAAILLTARLALVPSSSNTGAKKSTTTV